jgi:tRNA (uracil-5-)-methyltransferase TRM9
MKIKDKNISKDKKKISQEQVWDKIAFKWNEFKTQPSKYTEEFLKGKKGKILDVGCGSGRNFSSFSPDVEIYGVDFSKNLLNYARQNAKKLNKNVKLKKMKNEIIPYHDNYFNYALCTAVLHCIDSKKKRQKLIKEIYRVLKPEGEVLITVWSKNQKRLKNRPKETYVPWTSAGVKKRYTYIYNKDELLKEIKDAGFKIKKSGEDRNIKVIGRKY